MSPKTRSEIRKVESGFYDDAIKIKNRKKTKNMSKKDFSEERRIMTPEFVASYPCVFKTNSIKGSTPKFSITMLFPKNADLSVIKLAIKHAKIDEFGPNKTDWPTDMMSPVVDGDLPKYAKKEGYPGHWVIKASSMEEAKPTVFDSKGKEMMDAKLFYPGCIARAQIWARVWEFGSKQGIQFILDGVQKIKEGKPLSTRGPVKFDPIGVSQDEMDLDDASDDEDFT